MKKVMITIFVLFVGVTSLYAEKYESRIIGKWKMVSFTEGTTTEKISEKPGASGFFNFKNDGKCEAVLNEKSQKEQIYFTWKIIDSSRIELVEYKTDKYQDKNNTELFVFGFFDNKLLFIMKPDKTVLFEKVE